MKLFLNSHNDKEYVGREKRQNAEDRILDLKFPYPSTSTQQSHPQQFPNTPDTHKVLKAMDRISDLPKPILHDILSRLPEKDVARTSVLSKTWHDVWSTFPILVFDCSNRAVKLQYQDKRDAQKVQDYMRKLNNFMISIDNSLQRFYNRGFAIIEFNLSMVKFDFQSMPTRIDHWMKIATESRVKVLRLEFQDFSYVSLDKHYVLPLSVLEVKSLTKLELTGQIRVDKAFLNFGNKFSSLEVLSLRRVHFGHEQTLLNLISSCPLIENLTLINCDGLEVVRIHGLPKLKVAKFMLMSEVDVDAPSLENLDFDGGRLQFPCTINMDKCINLKELVLSSLCTISVTSQWLLELFVKFPLLEKLELDDCILSERIKISSALLKDLRVSAWSYSQLKEVEIDTPKLRSFTYCGIDFTMPAVSFLNTSIQLEFNIEFVIRFHSDLEGLMKLIQSVKPKNVQVSMTLRIHWGNIEFNPDALQDISFPSPRVKLLNLAVSLNIKELCCLLITSLFWSFRPTIVSLKLKYCSKIFIKLVCEKLLCKQEEEGCCSSSQIKCWWHDLKDVKVTRTFKKFEDAIDCQTLLDSLPSEMHTLSPEDVFSFRLEWA